MSDADVAAMWRDYFVFTVVRDPFERAVSIYHWLLREVRALPRWCREKVRGQV